jgi:hypothetical protein
VVLHANAEEGGQATPGAILAGLVGTETFWVQVAVPVDQLRWIRFPGDGDTPASEVTVILGEGETRKGRVLRRLPDLDANARMAKILVAIQDPLHVESAGSKQPLLLNDFVSVRIQGDMLKDVYVISRTALRDGNQVWFMDQDHAFRSVPVQVIWGNQEHVVLDDEIAAGKQLIVSALAAPVEGMLLRTTEEARAQQERSEDTSSKTNGKQDAGEPSPQGEEAPVESVDRVEVDRAE